MELKERILNRLRNIYRKNQGISIGLIKSYDKVDTTVEEYNKLLINAIINQNPFMVSRFGSEELKWYMNLKSSKQSFYRRYFNYITCKTEQYNRVSLRIIDNLTLLPRKSLNSSEVFYQEYKKAIKYIDILGSWLRNEKYVNFNSETRFVRLFDLEPYKSNNPWTLALEGKKVLVIHPMVELIYEQWPKRSLLFDNPIWPKNCELLLLKAKYFDEPEVDSWYKMMQYYKDQVDKIKYDVAIIGNGSWGLPLAAYIKNKGKVAVHLGGATQLIFGIYGNRWKDWKEYNSMFNDNWISGSLSEQKTWFENYDKRSYW